MTALFDSKSRTYMGFAGRAETTYAFYDRSGQPAYAKLRAMLERWISRLPVEHQVRFISRMKHKGLGSKTEEDSFNAAFFELFMHEFLVGTRADVVVEPNQGGLTPDFGAREGNLSYIVEATDLNLERNTALEDDWKEMRAIDALNQVESTHFRLWVRTNGKLASDVPRRPLLRRFQNLADNADYGEVLLEAQTNGLLSKNIPKDTFVHGNWEVTGTLMPLDNPVSELKGGFVSVRARGAGHVDDIGKLREKLRDKARTYKDIDNLIIAVRADQSVNRVTESLFGREAIVLEHTTNPNGPLEIVGQRQERQRDGLWFGNEGPRYENVIGVVVFYGIYPHSVMEAVAQFYSNPYMEKPLPAWATELPHVRYSPDGGMEMVDGRNPSTFMTDCVRFESPW